LSMGAPQVHHYVPQFLLDRFKDPEKDLLHVYDKKTDRVFTTSPQNVAAERSFYEIETDWGKVTAEPGLSALETIAAGIVEKLVKQESLAGLSTEERVKLSAFLAVQFSRTRNFRENIEDVNKQMVDRFRSLDIDPNQVENFKVLTEDDVKRFSIDFMIKSVEEFTPLFVNKLWLLARASTSNPLMLSDNPIALHNERKFGLYGNLGLGVPGIEIHFPLSRTLALQLLCPSFEEHFRKGDALIKLARKKHVKLDKKARRARRKTIQVIQALETGSPVDLNDQNVVRENYLQIRWGSRFVFSSDRKFGLVTKMLNDTSAYRTGPRSQLA